MSDTKRSAKVRMTVTPDMGRPTGVRVDTFCGDCGAKLSRFDMECRKCGTKAVKE